MLLGNLSSLWNLQCFTSDWPNLYSLFLSYLLFHADLCQVAQDHSVLTENAYSLSKGYTQFLGNGFCESLIVEKAQKSEVPLWIMGYMVTWKILLGRQPRVSSKNCLLVWVIITSREGPERWWWWWWVGKGRKLESDYHENSDQIFQAVKWNLLLFLDLGTPSSCLQIESERQGAGENVQRIRCLPCIPNIP